MQGVKPIDVPVFHDDRGWFAEAFRATAYRDLLGPDVAFVQDNFSRSARHVLRGLHFQVRRPQGKLVCVMQGEIYDVAVDLRRGSPTFGQWRGMTLAQPASATHRLLWIAPGFAHGFVALSDTAVVHYKCTDYYQPGDEACLAWNDPDLAIDWPVDAPILSERDKRGRRLADLFGGTS